MEATEQPPNEGSTRKASRLLNRAHVKRYMLARAQKTGRTKYTRVSGTTINDLEARVRVMIDNYVHSKTGKGITL